MEEKNSETQEHDEKDPPAQEDYLDFELEIGMGSGRSYPIAVRSAAGEARGVMQFPFDDLALENQLLTLQNALLRSGGKPRHILLPEEQSVQDFGRTLFATLFTGEIENLYVISQREAALQSKGLRLKLRILAPEMAALPWEFLYDPRHAEYICLSRKTPVVRYLEVPQPPQPLPATLPLQILGMIAAPTNLPALDVKREKERMEKALEPLQQRGLAQLTWLTGQTWRDVQQAMRRGPWHVFHFIGHGGFDPLSDEGLITFEDDQGLADMFRAIQLGRLLADHRSLRLVVLNACEGARSGRHDIFSSAAASLVRHGIPAVLAMQYTITDAAAIVFSRAFYEALADGWPIDAAVSEARKAVCFEVENTLEWGIPVLFMRSPDGVLFTISQGPTSALRQPPPPITRPEAVPASRQPFPLPVATPSITAAPRQRPIPSPVQQKKRRLWVTVSLILIGILLVFSIVFAALRVPRWLGITPTYTIVGREAQAEMPIQVSTSVSAHCLSGEQMLSGGYYISDQANPVEQSYPSAPDTWTVVMQSGFANDVLHAYVLCLQANFSAHIQIFSFTSSLDNLQTFDCPSGSALIGGGFRFHATRSEPHGNGWLGQSAFAQSYNNNYVLCATTNLEPASLQSQQFTIPPEARRSVNLRCPAGELLVGGGFTYDVAVPDVYLNGPRNDWSTWSVGAFNNNKSVSQNGTGWAVCVKVSVMIH